VYGVTYELGETVVGCAMPKPEPSAEQKLVVRKFLLTFRDLFSLVNFANLFIQ
jgi:hypothetical protein